MSHSGGHSRPKLRFEHYTRHLRRRPRLALSTACAIVLYFVFPAWMPGQTRLLLAFDLGAVGFLAAVWIMMARATPDSMRRRARIEDEGKVAVLTLSAAIAVAVLLAIGFQLHGIKDLSSRDLALHVGLAAATILLSWFFMNTMFALHYAHSYYDDAGTSRSAIIGGLAFPGEDAPDYWDFLYFSFVLGMTFQVSDVQITSRSHRRVALAHGVLAFFFNVCVLALTINIVAGLI